MNTVPIQMIYILKSLVYSIVKQTDAYYPLETGGMLLGYLRENNYYVLDLIEAGPGAVHGENFFLPDGKYQQPILEQKFHKSNGLITFIGDWHSHPNGESYLSNLDMKTLKDISEDEGSQITCPIFIIIGTSPFNLCGFNYENGKFQELPVKIVHRLQ